MLESIKKNDGKLIGRSTLQLKNLIDKVNQLNFYGDAEIESQIAEVKAQLDNKVKDRDVSEIQGALSELASLTRITLLELGETPRSARDVGVEDVTEEEMLRQTRLKEAEDVPELMLQRRVRIEEEQLATA